MDEEPHKGPVSQDLPDSVSQRLLTLAGCSASVVVGIDVGGPKKGFHAVALSGTKLLVKFRSADPATIAHWCREQGAEVIAIDAPCRWRRPGGPARAAERKLAEIRISCFSTPTEEQASGHPFYSWMLAGQELYAALASVYPLYDRGLRKGRVAIETFPQAVACALAGSIVSAKKKVPIRRELLSRTGLQSSDFRNIDEVDAALCALSAEGFLRGEFMRFGDPAGGFIIVPGRESIRRGWSNRTR